MQRRMTKYGGALFFAGVLALSGCSGSKGTDGANGTNGTNGVNGTNGTNGTNGQDLTSVEQCNGCHYGFGTQQHQAVYNSFSDGLGTQSKLTSSVLGATSVDNGDGTFTTTLTFSLKLSGKTITVDALKALKQKTIYAARYTGGQFTNAFTFSAATATVSGDVFTIVKTDAPYAVEAPAAGDGAFVYMYFGDKVVIPTTTGHYALMDNVTSAAKAYGTIGYTSKANVHGCEKCHTTPYSKHGYRQAVVGGLNDFVACKACHTDDRPGVDLQLIMASADPLLMLERQALPQVDGETDWGSGAEALYGYTANVMYDTHMSHANEFAYPQSMTNCVACHDDPQNTVLTAASFTLTTCKSCHPMKVGASVTAYGGVETGRPKAVLDIAPHTEADFANTLVYGNCSNCHNGSIAKTFVQIHSGYATGVVQSDGSVNAIYKADGTRYSNLVTVTIDSATFANNVLDIKFSAASTDSAIDPATIVPTMLVSLYGYDTKDFIVSAHNSDIDTSRNLEWQVGAAANPRVKLVSAAAGKWELTADLTAWAGKLADGSVKRAEIAVAPSLKIGGATVALNAPSKTFNLVTKAFEDAFAPIVDAAKCNKCHDALGVTFHNASYGGNVVLCRVCHTVRNGSSHLEMQGRSIDSFVHAVHSYQVFDIGPNTRNPSATKDFADPITTFRYEEHIGSTYPNFSILNCESCHNPGTYDVPSVAKSLPGIQSASVNPKNWTREITGFPAYVTGPAMRACGSCHRSQAINADDAFQINWLNAHSQAFGILEDGTAASLDATIVKVQNTLK